MFQQRRLRYRTRLLLFHIWTPNAQGLSGLESAWKQPCLLHPAGPDPVSHLGCRLCVEEACPSRECVVSGGVRGVRGVWGAPPDTPRPRSGQLSPGTPGQPQTPRTKDIEPHTYCCRGCAFGKTYETPIVLQICRFRVCRKRLLFACFYF